MNIIGDITKLLNLPIKIMFAIALASGLILFLPDSFIQKMYMVPFRNKYGFTIGIVFCISLSITAINIIVPICKSLYVEFRMIMFRKKAPENLKKLTPHQKEILYNIYKTYNHTQFLNRNDGDVNILEHGWHIYSISNTGTTIDFRSIEHPYTLHPFWVDLYKKKKIKSTSLYKIKSYHNARVSPTLGKMYLKDIKLIHIQKFINQMFDEGLSHGSISNIRFQLRDMFDKAILNDYITKNPCIGVELPRQIKKSSRVLTLQEQKKFFDIAESYIHINVLKFALLTGARIGEILGLTWADIDFNNKNINIDKTIHYSKVLSNIKDSKFFYTSAKTTASERVLPMTSEVEDVLKLQRIKQMQEKTFRGKAWNPIKELDNLVFCQNDGTPIYYSNIEGSIKSYVEKFNVVEIAIAKEEGRESETMEPFTCHTLRHTYATRCYEQKVPDKVIQSLLGHSKLETTMDIYTHITEDTQNKAVARLKILA